MGIIKNTLKKEIDNNNLQRVNNAIGTILEYNHKSNTAYIKYLNPNGEGYFYRDDVNISETVGGFTRAGISVGQLCNLNFIGNNIHNPVITGILTSGYNLKTCSDQGAFIASNNIINCEIPDTITPMVNNWLETDNDNIYKYNDQLGDYTNIDVSSEVYETLDTIDKYKNTEEGITNIITKSTIKFKDNGDIDIFVNNNTGIRINANTQTVNIYGLDILFNGKSINNLS